MAALQGTIDRELKELRELATEGRNIPDIRTSAVRGPDAGMSLSSSNNEESTLVRTCKRTGGQRADRRWDRSCKVL